MVYDNAYSDKNRHVKISVTYLCIAASWGKEIEIKLLMHDWFTCLFTQQCMFRVDINLLLLLIQMLYRRPGTALGLRESHALVLSLIEVSSHPY